MERRGAELKRIAVYAIDAPRPRRERERFLGKFDGDDFHGAFGRAKREVRREKDGACSRIEKIEFRLLRVNRVALWSLEGPSLRLKIEDPGTDMVSEFEQDPTVGNPLEFVHAHVDGRRFTTRYPGGDRESLIDHVARIASGELIWQDKDGHPVNLSTITQFHGYRTSCKVLTRRFDREWYENLLAAVLRTEFALQYRTDGLEIPHGLEVSQ